MSFTYAIGVAAAIVLVMGLGWEVIGRQVGSSRTPGALLARVAGRNPVGASNVTPVEQPIIAVLPFKNLSVEPESDYFVDGLTDEIIRNLAVIQGLQVRSRTSSFAFKDKPRNLRDVGEQLGANLIVEGSVLRSGSKRANQRPAGSGRGRIFLSGRIDSIESSTTSSPFRMISRGRSSTSFD